MSDRPGQLFSTGNTEDAASASFLIVCSGQVWFKRNLIEALRLMTNPDNWLQAGDVTPDAAADLATIMLENLTEVD